MMPNRAKSAVTVVAALVALSGCTVQPLYGTGPDATTAQGNASSITVSEAKNRITQQVRNHLVYRLGRQGAASGNPRDVALTVSADVKGVLTVGADGVSNTSVRQLEMTGTVSLVDPQTDAVLSRDTRTTTASFDATGQEFANDRARIDAENRAARELAEQLFVILRVRLAAS